MGSNLELKAFTGVDWAGSIDADKELVEEHSFFVRDLCLGQVRNKFVSLNPQ